MSLTTVWLVAKREVTLTLRARAFKIGLFITALLVGAAAFAPTLLGGPDEYKIGLVNSKQLPMAQAVPDAKWDWVTFPDRAAATKAVLDGDVDVALVDDNKILSDGEVDSKLGVMLQSVNRETKLGAAGVNVPPLAVESVGADTRYQGARMGIAFLFVIVLFGLVIQSATAVAMGVVEEKGSRIVEILLASLRPWQLLTGKVLGMGLVGLINMAVVLVVGLGAAVASGFAADFPPGMPGVIAGVLVWFVLGYAFFATFAASLGSLVSRQEEVQNVLGPMMMTIMITYGFSFYAAGDPTSTLATIVSMIPPLSSMVMPVRMAATTVPFWEVGLSMAFMVLAVAAMAALGSRVYERAVTRTGARVNLLSVLRER
ncbi:ABC transporter permease [Nonomuraea sp. NPDC050328]|uniref:ABC transporter permease n=1 Tax=Nonomuraea sp. NPDC050328 TaxID=3364361 RepID=UPI00379A0039